MTLQIFNVLGRQKQPFTPIHEGRVGMYVCGPTVYEHSHLGHAKTYVSFDVVARYLRYRGDDLLYVQNITDVGHLLANEEDRILRRARPTQRQADANRRDLYAQLFRRYGCPGRSTARHIAASERPCAGAD